MGSTGLSFAIKRVGEGDVSELFYALKEQLNEWVWNSTSTLTGFSSYLGSDEFHIWMSDRWDANETDLWFAFWEEEVEEPLCDYAMHVATLCVTNNAEEITAMGARHGFAIDFRAHTPADHGYFAFHGSSRVCRVQPWRRGEPVDAAPRFACADGAAHRSKEPSESQRRRLRACAMTGLCACPRCGIQRGKPDLLSEAIPLAWQALDSDARGAALAAAAATDALAAGKVLGDWLAERGVVLAPTQLAALATSHAAAAPFAGCSA